MENPQVDPRVYEQLKLWYTPEEVDAKVSEVTRQWNSAVTEAYKNTSEDLRDRAISWFKSEVRGGSMAKEDALGIFNGLADALNWTTIDTLSSTYTVSVYFRGNLVGEFEEVEADDSDEAENKVLEDMGVEANMNIELDFNGNTISDEIGIDSWDIADDFTAEAVED